MEQESTIPPKKPRSKRGPYKKRHWCVDAVTGKRFRSAHPQKEGEPRFANHANQQFARNQRLEAEAVAAVEAERQAADLARQQQADMDRRIEEHRQAQAAEDKRLEREQAQQAADQQKQRQRDAQVRELARRAAEVQRLYSPCKRCGSSHFNVQALEVPVHFLTTKLKLELKVKCAHCGERSSYVIQPGPCPICKHYVYIWDVASGGLQCRECKSTRQWRDYRIDVPLPEPYDPPINLR